MFTHLFTHFLGKRWGAAISVLGIITYTLMVGANPAVVRTAILGMLSLLAIQVSWRQLGLNSMLPIAALKFHFARQCPLGRKHLRNILC